MRIQVLSGLIAAALLAFAPAPAAALDSKPAYAKQAGAQSANAAIDALSADDEWVMEGREVAQRILDASSASSLRAAASRGNARAQ